jgi:hypothetical protein
MELRLPTNVSDVDLYKNQTLVGTQTACKNFLFQ